ncbi:MAG: nucleotidyltransferase family protein [Erythrobacter sp.]|jgi:hypothetical protein|nr:nucleotidyltransferase family protein [Erythrobacter sp.]
MAETDPISDAASETAPIDGFLAACLRSRLGTAPLPSWPPQLDQRQREVASRVFFHGIALLLWEGDPIAAGWPEGLAQRLRQEAAGQCFWEQSEHQAIGGLLEAFADAGLAAVVLKGTALAYSLYRDPAMRRRGDTDVLIAPERMALARRVLRAAGFAPVGERLIFQEMWVKRKRGGFVHTIDLHWRIDGSATVSSLLERGKLVQRTMPLPRLSQRAVGLDPLANLLLVCINRAEHEVHGYLSAGEKLYEGDRLIWAADLDAICASLSHADWAELLQLARATGTSQCILSGLEFAHQALGTQIPEDVRAELLRLPGAQDLMTYLSTRSTLVRLRLEIASTPRRIDKLRHLGRALAPQAQMLRERFPDHPRWPIAALRARRLVEGLLKAMRAQV